MNPVLRFLRSHLNTEREPLLLGPAPIRVEVEWSAQQVLDAIFHTLRQAFDLLANLDPIGPFDSNIIVAVELTTWGIPERPAQWLVRQLPERIILHFAEMINHD